MAEEKNDFVTTFTDISTLSLNGIDNVSTSSSNHLTNGHGSTRDLPEVPVDSRPLLPVNPPRSIPPRIKVSKPPSEISKFIPEQEITIPNDGNVSKFTVEELSTFLKHMGTSDRIVNHLRKKNVDGKRFSKLSDSELDTVGIKNPIIMYFRDRSTKSKKTLPFML